MTQKNILHTAGDILHAIYYVLFIEAKNRSYLHGETLYLRKDEGGLKW